MLEDKAEEQREGELQIHSESHFWAHYQSLLLQTPQRTTRRWDNWTPSRQVKPQLPGQLLLCHAEAAPQPLTCAVLQPPSGGKSTVPGPQQLVAAQLCCGRVPVPSWHPQKQLSSVGSWVQAQASSRSRYEAGRSPLEPRSCLVAGEVVVSRIQGADACGVETVSASEIRSVGAAVLYL